MKQTIDLASKTISYSWKDLGHNIIIISMRMRNVDSTKALSQEVGEMFISYWI